MLGPDCCRCAIKSVKEEERLLWSCLWIHALGQNSGLRLSHSHIHPGFSQSESVMTFPEPLLQLTVSMCWCGFGWSAVWLQISGLPAAAALKWTEWSQSDVQRNALQVSVTALHAVRSTEVMSTLAQWATLKPAHCKQPMLTCQRPRLARQGELSLQFLLTNDDRV